MPVINGVGQSEMTPYKQTDLSDLLHQHIRTVQAIQMKYSWPYDKYVYIDMNAGPGYYANDECYGSPLVFLQTARELHCNVEAYFVEQNPEIAKSLQDRLKDFTGWKLFIGDNASVWPEIVKSVPHNAFGLLYTDPNGVPDFDTLVAISKVRAMKKIDFLIRYSGAATKRAGARWSGSKMLDHLKQIRKSHWIVKEPMSSDKWQWSFLLGLNWGGLGAWGTRGFRHADTPIGLGIMERLNYTNEELRCGKFYNSYQEYLAHPLYRMVRQRAIDRSQGICERCKSRPVTEVHHLEYPPWGTFEKDASKLQAVCHECHCELEGKED